MPFRSSAIQACALSVTAFAPIAGRRFESGRLNGSASHLVKGLTLDDERLKHDRELITAELPEATLRGERLREAAAENTIRGHLRKAIHQSQRPLDSIARAAGIPIESLCDWMSADRTLRSDVHAARPRVTRHTAAASERADFMQPSTF